MPGMQLTDNDIREFVVWSAEFHETISDEEAKLSASMLLDLWFLLVASESEGGL